jgi:hypothetical protein
LVSNDSYKLDISFSALIITLSSSAWVGLGKIADPVSGEVKKDLNTAKFGIDTLLMLREKTSGNLDNDEKELIDSIIADLQANFAETVFTGEGEGTEIQEEKVQEEEKKQEPEKEQDEKHSDNQEKED